MSREALERSTGKLFGDLWGPYDRDLFEKSVDLFNRRLDLMDFDKNSIKGKICLDAGCGGGRNSIALARLGAKFVQGIDLGEKGIEDAKRRADGMDNVAFQMGSILDLPYSNESYDLVIAAGVLMHLDDEDVALDELTRVLKKDGTLYLLVYATGGMRWPLIKVLRPIAAELGQPDIERAMEAALMPANKRRTFLDDLFVPKFDFFTWDRMTRMLKKRGYTQIRRADEKARLDHEHSLVAYRADLESLLSVFEAGKTDLFQAGEKKPLYEHGYNLVSNVIDTISWFEKAVVEGKYTEFQAMECVIGQGHHRVFATKS